MSNERSGLYRLDLKDVLRGLVAAIAGAVCVSVLGYLHGVFSAPGFDIFAQDWGMVTRQVINIAIIAAEGAFGGYLSMNFFRNDKGDIPTPVGTIKLSK